MITAILFIVAFIWLIGITIWVFESNNKLRADIDEHTERAKFQDTHIPLFERGDKVLWRTHSMGTETPGVVGARKTRYNYGWTYSYKIIDAENVVCHWAYEGDIELS